MGKQRFGLRSKNLGNGIRRIEKMATCSHCKKNATRKGSEYCSPGCEIAALKEQLAERDEKLALSRRDRSAQCLGQVKWSECIQEWYVRDSYDAKRRANELRKLGFTVAAKHLGEMPISTPKGSRLTHVTVLTAWGGDGAKLTEPDFIEGLTS